MAGNNHASHYNRLFDLFPLEIKLPPSCILGKRDCWVLAEERLHLEPRSRTSTDWSVLLIQTLTCSSESRQDFLWLSPMPISSGSTFKSAMSCISVYNPNVNTVNAGLGGGRTLKFLRIMLVYSPPQSSK